MRLLGLLFVLVVGGCIRTSATTCADGVTMCAEGTRCAPVGERLLCATPEQLSACDDLAAGESCGAERRCYEIDDGLVCWPRGCGNEFLDIEEQCDDGNTVSEDGCSADCFSTETCGNGVVDALFGELCDDGNAVSHDGCSSRCDLESAGWRERIVDDVPGSRSEVAMTYDVRRARVVIFGGTEPGPGSSQFFLTTTYEWDGSFAVAAPTTTTPEGRASAGFAYDDRRGVSVIFGGTRETGFSADTWEWTGTAWRPLDASGPVARASPALAYDAVGDRMVLFGGQDGTSEMLADTWALSEDVWTRLPDGPAASPQPTMTFDPDAGVIALVTNGVQWELRGTTWTQIGAVPASTAQRMWIVFEPSLGERLLLGDDGSGLLKTWAFRNNVWVELSRASTFAGTIRHVVADRVRGGVIGLRVAGFAVWNAAGELALVDNPVFTDASIRTSSVAVNDPLRGVVVQFGGGRGDRVNQMLTDDMFVFDGRLWTESLVAKKPSPRRDHAMVYDPIRNRIVLFGGETDTGLSSETWTWDGAAWSEARPPTSPGPRANHSMAFDPDAGRVVMFGGRDDEGGATDETWEWDGQTWARRLFATRPPPRLAAMLAHDPNGGGLLLFGGSDHTQTGQVFDDTWRLTAAGWARIDTVLNPTPRRFSQLTWAPARRRLILTGGERIDDSGIILLAVPVGDSWEWDGARWRPLFSSPLLVTQHVAFASPDGTMVMALGGNLLDDGAPGDFFAHLWSDGGTYETCASRLDADGDGLAACTDPDCWSVCDPLCPPGTASCPTTPRCGDQSCSSLENRQICPLDCGAPPVMCGDAVCDGSEMCAGDC
ncbi:MAG: kelch repeat-containing protein [Kofleriaceae bacterium]